MAGIDIPTMMEIQCEVAPSTLFDDLAKQEQRGKLVKCHRSCYEY